MELEHARLWEGDQPTDGDAVQQPERGETAVGASARWPDVAHSLGHVDEAQAAASRRQRQRDYDAEWSTDPYISGYAVRSRSPRLNEEHSASRGPSLGA